MKIGMILDSTFPPDPRVENEAQTLIEAGHQVFLFCLDYTHTQPEHEVIKGIVVCRKRLPAHVYKFSVLAYTIPYYHLVLVRGLTRFLVQYQIEALHIHDIQVARSAFIVNRKLKLPVVLDLHENRPEIMKYYPHVNSVLGRILIHPKVWKWFENRYIRKATKVVVVTNEAKEYYLSNTLIDSEKFYVVPNSVRSDFYTHYSREEEIIRRYQHSFMLLYIGDTGVRRGLKTVLDSIKYLKEVVSNLKLVIVGKSSTDSQLKEIVHQQGCEDFVDFVGWKEPDLLPSYIISCKIGICPIHRNIHHDTTFANKLFQYISFSKPVVVSNCTAQENLVRKYNCGLVFQDQDSADFTKQIERLATDETLYRTLASNAARAIETELNWEILSRELVELYQELE